MDTQKSIGQYVGTITGMGKDFFRMDRHMTFKTETGSASSRSKANWPDSGSTGWTRIKYIPTP